MPVTLNELRRNTRMIPVPYDGITLNITYRPSAVTPAFGNDDSKSFLVDALLALLVAWDVYEDEAYTEMTPISRDTLNSDAVGLALLRAMFDAIMLDTLTGKRSGAISAAG